MAPFDRRDLEALLVPQPAPCVSVFLPAPGPMGARPSVRLRNLLREAEERPPSTDGATLMEPLAALARSDAWPHPAEGLALFRRRARGGGLPAMVTVPT